MRFVRVLNREIQESKRTLFIYSLTIFLVLFFQEMVGAFVTRMTGNIISDAVYEGSFPGFLFLGGFITTSMVFAQDMFSRTGQHNWLTLPASTEEKFLAKALLTAIAYPLVLTIIFTLSSVVIETLALLFFGNPFTMFNPFGPYVGKMILHFIATQSVFLLGATYFRKAHFVKTILALGLIGFALSILATLFVRIVFAPYVTGMFGFHVSLNVYDFQNYTNLLTIGEWIGNIAYWALLPAFCWFTAYLRVKEVQSTDAVQ